jgi:hypothetical protein
MQDYQSFALQCQHEINTTFEENNSLPNSAEKQKESLATQVHQIVWHSANIILLFQLLIMALI